MNDIDIVIPWVDGNDKKWQNERNRYLQEETGIKAEAIEARYRDWDNVQYIFRGIEKFMPWVRMVHFVTWGHIPKWMNRDHPKLHVVTHDEFMPSEYLPTFNSNSIEVNIFRIPGLAEQYINFNDDMFVIKPTRPEDFFVNGLPCDTACISPPPIFRSNIVNVETNNLEIINDHFTIEDIRKNRKKWLNPVLYGQYALRTAIFMRFSSIIGIFVHHIPYSYTKSVVREIWSIEKEILDRTSKHKFRSVEDVNEWLFREWQLVSGNFIPRSKNFGILVPAGNIEEVRRVLFSSKYKIACINDGSTVTDFEKMKKAVNHELQKLLPEKSMYEL